MRLNKLVYCIETLKPPTHSDLEKSADKASEIQARKNIYKKIADLWPEAGWVTSTNISSQCEEPEIRSFSAAETDSAASLSALTDATQKKKIERAAAREEADA